MAVPNSETNSNSELVFEPPPQLSQRAHVKSMEEYQQLHAQSVNDPSGFWLEIANSFHWQERPPSSEGVINYNFDVTKGRINIEWFKGWKTNACYNALDRHVHAGHGSRVCFYWEGNYPDDQCTVTYGDLLSRVSRFASVLKHYGVRKGDPVAIYMPMIIETIVAVLACARIGAVHCVVFGGFSASSLADRIIDCKCHHLITCDGVWRGAKLLHLKDIADKAMAICVSEENPVTTCIVVKHVSTPPFGPRPTENTNAPGMRPANINIEMEEARDIWWHDALGLAPAEDCPVEWMDAEEPLFMLYTSGSTGKPKGVLHTIGGYIVYVATTFKYTFDYHIGDIFWCTADVGWITGHSYLVYGPMSAGATSVMFEGIPNWPTPSRCWQIIDKYQVTQFYTAPTAIRTLMKAGDHYVQEFSKRTSLSVLGSVGEPINPEAWLWYFQIVGNGRCAVVDTFWQTETGGHMITPLPGATQTKPGSACYPFFGVRPLLVNPETGVVIEGEGEGYLVFAQPWPGIMRTVFGNHHRFEQTYFSKFPGYYTTGDGARRDADGYLWITGRIDDMLNVSGHLLSTAEIESALVEHPSVVEAAVVGRSHSVKGESAYAFVTLRDGSSFDGDVVKQLKLLVREKIGPIAVPDDVQEAPGLPKTRSGKIMRRILREISAGEDNFGDTSTLADPSVIDQLLALRVP